MSRRNLLFTLFTGTLGFMSLFPINTLHAAAYSNPMLKDAETQARALCEQAAGLSAGTRTSPQVLTQFQNRFCGENATRFDSTDDSLKWVKSVLDALDADYDALAATVGPHQIDRLRDLRQNALETFWAWHASALRATTPQVENPSSENPTDAEKSDAH